MPKQRVLFLCTGNSCRSQMAEGWLRHLADADFEVRSAGTQPGVLNPDAVRAMQEAGIDISHHRSRSVAELEGRDFDFVITVCDHARQNCPVFPARTRSLHWSIEDPAEATGTREERDAVFRGVRDEIERKIRDFLAATGDDAGR